MIKIDVVKSDKLYDINFTLQDANGAAFDLTNNTQILLKAQQQGSTSLKFTGTMAVVGAPTLGTCKYTVQTTDFDATGQYYAEIEVTYSGGKVVTFPDIVISVLPELPR